MKTILCPVDFSANAANAAEYACALAEKLSARVILFHAYEEPVMVTETTASVIEDIKSSLRTSAEKQIRLLEGKLQTKFPKCQLTTSLSQGAGHEEIVAAAERFEATVILMGTTGNSRLDRLLIGSTTARVLKDASCPVFCIPKESKYQDFRKIIFATDLKNDNILAAVNIAPFAMKFGAEIVFVFIDNKHLMHDEKDILNMTYKIKSRVKYPKISGYVANSPDIERGIESFTKKYEADLLVMFAHDKPFPESLLHRSFTKSMSNKITMPLLVLKGNDPLTF